MVQQIYAKLTETDTEITNAFGFEINNIMNGIGSITFCIPDYDNTEYITWHGYKRKQIDFYNRDDDSLLAIGFIQTILHKNPMFITCTGYLDKLNQQICTAGESNTVLEQGICDVSSHRLLCYDENGNALTFSAGEYGDYNTPTIPDRYVYIVENTPAVETWVDCDIVSIEQSTGAVVIDGGNNTYPETFLPYDVHHDVPLTQQIFPNVIPRPIFYVKITLSPHTAIPIGYNISDGAIDLNLAFALQSRGPIGNNPNPSNVYFKIFIGDELLPRNIGTLPCSDKNSHIWSLHPYADNNHSNAWYIGGDIGSWYELTNANSDWTLKPIWICFYAPIGEDDFRYYPFIYTNLVTASISYKNGAFGSYLGRVGSTGMNTSPSTGYVTLYGENDSPSESGINLSGIGIEYGDKFYIGYSYKDAIHKLLSSTGLTIVFGDDSIETDIFDACVSDLGIITPLQGLISYCNNLQFSYFIRYQLIINSPMLVICAEHNISNAVITYDEDNNPFNILPVLEDPNNSYGFIVVIWKNGIVILPTTDTTNPYGKIIQAKNILNYGQAYKTAESAVLEYSTTKLSFNCVWNYIPTVMPEVGVKYNFTWGGQTYSNLICRRLTIKQDGGLGQIEISGYFGGASTPSVENIGHTLAKLRLDLDNNTALNSIGVNAIITRYSQLTGLPDLSRYLTSANIEDSVTNGHTTVAPSGNAVFDSLALKLSLTNSGNNVSDPTLGGDVATKNWVEVTATANNSAKLGNVAAALYQQIVVGQNHVIFLPNLTANWLWVGHTTTDASYVVLDLINETSTETNCTQDFEDWSDIALPSGIKGVMIMLESHCSSASVWNQIYAIDPDYLSANCRVYCRCPSDANYWQNQFGFVAVSTDYKFRLYFGRGAGTITGYIKIIGYFL